MRFEEFFQEPSRPSSLVNAPPRFLADCTITGCGGALRGAFLRSCSATPSRAMQRAANGAWDDGWPSSTCSLIWLCVFCSSRTSCAVAAARRAAAAAMEATRVHVRRVADVQLPLL
eukprot:6207805-Pleurochrysis_carterae.AAC.1